MACTYSADAVWVDETQAALYTAKPVLKFITYKSKPAVAVGHVQRLRLDGQWDVLWASVHKYSLTTAHNVVMHGPVLRLCMLEGRDLDNAEDGQLETLTTHALETALKRHPINRTNRELARWFSFKNTLLVANS